MTYVGVVTRGVDRSEERPIKDRDVQPRKGLRSRAACALARLRCERGQTLVIFVGFIGVALAFVALVVDGGEYFFKSREAQNAADAGALAGALRLCPQDTDAHRATCEDNAQSTAADYAQAKNMTDGAPTVTLLTKDGAPVSASNPYTKVRVQIAADAPLFFADLLGVSSTKAVGACRADDPPSVGQCAIASATQELKTVVVTTPATTTTTPGTTTTTYPNNLFAFAKGGYDGGACDGYVFKIPGNDNVFNGAIWSNESLDVPLHGNGADLTTLGIGCTPSNIDDDHFTTIAHHAPIGWPVEPPPLVPISGTPCVAGGKVASTNTPNATWLASNPPGIYCTSSSKGFTLSLDLNLAGYSWVATTITTTSPTSASAKPLSPATGSKVLFYAYGGRSGRCDPVINTSGPSGIVFTGYMIAPNGGITMSAKDGSAIEGFIEALCLRLTSNGTTFTGMGPSPTPITTTTPATTTTTPGSTNTVTTPGDVSADLDW